MEFGSTLIVIVFLLLGSLITYLKANNKIIFLITKGLVYGVEIVTELLQKKGYGKTKKEIVLKFVVLYIEKIKKSWSVEKKKALIEKVDKYLEEVVENMQGIKEQLEIDDEITSIITDKVTNIEQTVEDIIQIGKDELK